MAHNKGLILKVGWRLDGVVVQFGNLLLIDCVTEIASVPDVTHTLSVEFESEKEAAAAAKRVAEMCGIRSTGGWTL